MLVPEVQGLFNTEYIYVTALLHNIHSYSAQLSNLGNGGQRELCQRPN